MILCWPLVNKNSKWRPVLRYYCPNVSQLVCNWRKHATRCSQSGCLVSVDGVNECISKKVWNSGKTNTFLILLAFLLGSMSAVFWNLCLSRLDLVILWPKVVKNYGVPKIRVFLGLIFGISLAQSAEESWIFLKFVSFWVWFLVFLWPKVPKSHSIPKIHVFLHPEMLKFCLVGELSCRGCELEIEC